MTVIAYERGYGGYTLSQLPVTPDAKSEYQQLLEARDRLLAAVRTDPSQEGLGQETYLLLLSLLEDENGEKKSGVDQAVYNWIKGAAAVNANDGVQAELIRAYTAAQYQLRGYTHAGSAIDGFVSETSNHIALRLANDILTNDGTLPSIVGLGFSDAGAAAQVVFRGDATPAGDLAPWAGTVLFPALNNTPDPVGQSNADPRKFFVDWMLTNQTVQASIGDTTYQAKNIEGTYDFMSSIVAFYGAVTSIAANFGNVFELCQGVIDSDHENLVEISNQYFWDTYGISEDSPFTPGSFLPFSGVLSSGLYTASTQFYRVGTLDDDELDYESERGNHQSLVVNAGLGDDRLVLLGYNDLADGGAGTDTLRYSDVYGGGLGGVQVSITQPDFVDTPEHPALYTYRIESRRLGLLDSQKSYVFDFETIELTSHADRLLLEEALPDDLDLRIDGRRTETDTFDLIDASGSSGGVAVGISASGSGTVEAPDGSGGTLQLENFRAQVKGSDHADRIEIEGAEYLAPDARTEVDGGGGNDNIRILGGQGALVFGGAGDDVILNASFGGVSTGGEGSDTFHFTPDTLVADAEAHDRLVLYGVTLTGGIAFGGEETQWAVQQTLPFIRYGLNRAGDLVVNFARDLMYVADYVGGPAAPENSLGIYLANIDFTVERLIDLGSPKASPLDDVLTAMFKSMGITAADDPLALDLDGDGLEFTTEGQSRTYFDLDGDGFAERTGWLRPDDGWLARDLDADGSIDDVGELFGGPGISGFADLAALDDNGDGVVDATDGAFGELRVWRDLNQDGISQTGEIATLAEHAIVSIELGATPLGTETSTGHVLAAVAGFARADGTRGQAYDVLLDNSQLLTRYLGDRSVTDWAAALPDVKGYGLLTDLSVAASRDTAVAGTLASVLPTLDVADLPTLAARIEPLLLAWNAAAAGSRELTAVLVGTDPAGAAQRLDHAVYEEDASGGWWQLASGAPVLAADGTAIARPGLEQVLAQATAAGQDWRIEEHWSPAGRAAPLQRTAAPYLVATGPGGTAAVLDYGIYEQDADGGWWRMASGAPVLAADGTAIARPSLHDVLAQDAAEGQAWRGEAFAAPAPPAAGRDLALFYRDGQVHDFAVFVDDPAGGYWASARAVGQAAAAGLAAPDGPTAADLQSFVAAYRTADPQVTDSRIFDRGTVSYAARTGGADLQELTVLTAGLQANGALDYAYNLADQRGFLQALVERYAFWRDAVAVRLAAQGPLASFFEGLDYDAVEDVFRATTSREMVPLFERIFAAAPADAAGALAHLQQWRPILDVVYADFERHGNGAMSPGLLFANVVAAFESQGLAADIVSAAGALGVPAGRIVTHEAADAAALGDQADNFIYSGVGDQVLSGGQGMDTYVIGRNFGSDVLREVEAFGTERAPDIVRFADTRSTEVSARREGLDLIVSVTATGDTLRIEKQFEGRQPDLFGNDVSEDTGVARIAFADGMVWEMADMAWAVRDPQAGDQVLTGTPEIDVLDGGGGSDVLSGGTESDIYVFGLGYGADTVSEGEANLLVAHNDLVLFGEGIAREDLILARDGNSDDLTITLAQSPGDSLTIRKQFAKSYTGPLGGQWLERVELLTFADHRYWSAADVMEEMVARAKTAGNDTIWGFAHEDRLDGGAGDDRLGGGNENDLYVFGLGYGHDRIRESIDTTFNILSGQIDTVAFGAGIAAADLRLSRQADGGDLRIELADGSSLTVEGQFVSTYTGALGQQWFDRVERFVFTAGGVPMIDHGTVMDRLIAEASTAGDDAIYGFDRSDVLDGGAGDDLLSGGNENDTYLFGLGYGRDTIREYQQGYAILSGQADTVRFGAGVLADSVVLSRGADIGDLVVTLTDGSRLTVEDQFSADNLGNRHFEVERFEFADGTAWTVAEIQTRLLRGTPGDDRLIGFYSGDRLDGGAGDDRLEGGDGGDTYVFGRGYGADRVLDEQASIFADAPDRVVFASGIAAGDVWLSRPAGADDLVLSLIDGSRLTIEKQFSANTLGHRHYAVERFEFADGTVWTVPQIQARLLVGSAGDDTLVGFSTNDMLDGGAGNDRLDGGDGADTYVFGNGYGVDVVFDQVTSVFAAAGDRVLFAGGVAPGDVVLSRPLGTDDLVLTLGDGSRLTIEDQFLAGNLGHRYNEIERFEFADGTVWTVPQIQARLLAGTPGNDTLVGFFWNDTLDGGAGNDRMEGGDGGDTYVYGRGYGADIIRDQQTSIFEATPDRIAFAAGVAPGDLAIARGGAQGEHLVLTIRDTAETLTVLDAFRSAYTRIETFAFADGTSWSHADVFARVTTLVGTAGADTLQGYADSETLTGGLGNDLLRGGHGSDVYRYTLGDGSDVIRDQGYAPEYDVDRLRFLGTLSATDVVLRRRATTSFDLEVVLPDGATIVVQEQFGINSSFGIEIVEFADGTRIDRAQIRQAVLTGTDAGERIVGFDGADAVRGHGGADLLEGGAGNDALYGGAGDDVLHGQDGDDILYGGDGDDRLVGGGGADAFDGGAGRDTADFSYSGAAWTIDLSAGTAGGESLVSIENIVGSSGNDTITGDGGDNVLDGGAGNDVLRGGAGDDVLIGGLGTDSFDGGAGNDTADFSYSSAAWVIDLAAGSASGESLTGIENVIAGTGGDKITGDAQDNRLEGGAGNDTLAGGAGTDTAVYRGNLRDYVVRAAPDGVRVRDLSAADGDEGEDILTGIERLSFADTVIDLDGVLGPLAVEARIVVPEGVAAAGRIEAALPDGHAGPSNYTLFQAAANGQVQLQADGSYLYVPNAGFNGQDTFLVRMTDALGLGDLAKVTVSVGKPDPVSPIRFADAYWRLNATGDANYWQFPPATAALGDGGYVVAWPQEGADGALGGVLARLFDRTGSPVTGEIQVNAHTSYNQMLVSAAGLTGGGFVMVWTSEHQDGSQTGIYARRFNAAGQAVGGEIRINATTVDYQRRPAVTATGDGGFVVTWESLNQDGSAFGVYMRRFDAAGVAQSGEIRVNSTTAQWQYDAQVTVLSDGRLLAVWTSEALDGSHQAIAGQLFTASGSRIGGEFRINQFATGSQVKPAVAALAGGGFVVAFEQWGQAFATSSGADLAARIYGADGVPLGSEIHLAADLAAGDQISPAVAALADGGFFVVWGSKADDTVRGRRFDATGTASGDAVVLADYAISEDWAPQVTVLDDGGIAVTWQASRTQGGNTGVYTRVVLGDHVHALTGGTGADVLIGDGADERLQGGAGNDRLTGGGGSDTYLFGRGDGADVIDDAANDATSTDRVRFGATIAADQLWLSRRGDDLDVAIVGEADSVSIDDWFVGDAHRVDAFELASGETLAAAQVQMLVDAMAAFTPPPPGSERIPPEMMDQLQGTIAAAWTPSA